MLRKLRCLFGFHDICHTSDIELSTCIHYCRHCAKPLKVYVVGINMTAMGFSSQEEEDLFLADQKLARELKELREINSIFEGNNDRG